jgi:hypothetical protein
MSYAGHNNFDRAALSNSYWYAGGANGNLPIQSVGNSHRWATACDQYGVAFCVSRTPVNPMTSRMYKGSHYYSIRICVDLLTLLHVGGLYPNKSMALQILRIYLQLANPLECKLHAILVSVCVWRDERLRCNFMLQVVGPIQTVSTLGIFSSPTTRIILIFKIGYSATSTFMMLMPTEAGLCKTGRVLTGGQTLATSMARLCASRKKVRLRSNALRSPEVCTPIVAFGEAIGNNRMTTALVPLTRDRAGLLPPMMAVSGFK